MLHAKTIEVEKKILVVTPENHSDMKAIAARRGCSLGKVVAEAVEAYIKEWAPQLGLK